MIRRPPRPPPFPSPPLSRPPQGASAAPASTAAAAAPAVAAAPASPTHAGPPPAKIEPFVETLHGVEVRDPYRWMERGGPDFEDRKSTRLNSSHLVISYAVFC